MLSFLLLLDVLPLRSHLFAVRAAPTLLWWGPCILGILPLITKAVLIGRGEAGRGERPALCVWRSAVPAACSLLGGNRLVPLPEG